MRAITYAGKGKIQTRNIPKPTVRHDEALLRIRSVGICGTDLHIYHGGTNVKRGTVIGHEFSGDELSSVIPRAGERQKSLGLLFRIHRVHGQEAFFAGTTVPDDDSSEDLDRTTETVFAAHRFPLPAFRPILASQ